MSYAFELEDGSVAVCSLLSSVPEGATYAEVTEFPEDKSQRNAWRLTGSKITLDAGEVEKIVNTQAKKQKEEALSKLTITTSNGNTFDANETARNNMLSTLQSASFIGATTTEWKMADNTKVVIDIPELQQALALAIQEVGSIVVGE